MRHYILSRFNSVPVDPIQRAKAKYLDSEWMAYRLRLAYLYQKSLANQTCRNFQVVVAVHPQTPQYIVNFFKRFAVVWPRQISEFPFQKGAITTRLDTDDVIHQDFIREIQKVARHHQKTATLIDFATAWHDLKTGKTGKTHRRLTNSPFLSTTRSTKARYCYSRSHSNMPAMFSNRKKIDIIGGVQLLHDHNIFAKMPNTEPILLDPNMYGLTSWSL